MGRFRHGDLHWLVRLAWRRAGALSAVLFVVTLGSPFGGARAAAEGGQQVGDAQAVTLPSGFTPPAGLRQLLPLAGVAFVAPSISAGFYGHIDGMDGSFVPSQSGDELLVVSTEAFSFAPPFDQTPYHYAAPQLSVVFNGHSVSLAPTPDGSVSGVAGSAYGDDGAQYSGSWVVALPKDAPVRLVAAEDGFSQSLDLRTGVRVGSSPEVLYRDQSGPLGLDLRPNLAGTLVVTAGGSRVSFPVTLHEAALNYFNLDSPDAGGGLSADQAWLFVDVSFGVGVDQTGRADWYFDPAVPAHALSVSVDHGADLTPTQSPGPPDPTDTGTLFKGLYGFVVSASATSAAITVGAGTAPSVYYEGPDDLNPTAEPVSSATPANFTVSFPRPNPATLTPTPTTPAEPPTTSSSSPVINQPVSLAGGASRTHAGTAGGDWGDIGWGAGAGTGVVVLILGGVFISRRTRLVEARPVKPEENDVDGVVPSEEADATAPEQIARLDDSVIPAPPLRGEPSASQLAPELAADAPKRPRLRVRLIGPLDVEGTMGTIRRVGVLRVLLLLCLNLGRPISSGELRNRLATSEESEPSAPTVRSELSRLRKILPEGLLADREPGLGYALPADEVEVDWFVFKTLVAQATTENDAMSLQTATNALRLVRGPVLEHRSWHGVDPLVWEMTAEIERFASRSAELALQMKEPALAAEIARFGLAGAPGSPGLWRVRIRAAASGSGENLDQLKKRAKEDTGEDVAVDLSGYKDSGALT